MLRGWRAGSRSCASVFPAGAPATGSLPTWQRCGHGPLARTSPRGHVPRRAPPSRQLRRVRRPARQAGVLVPRHARRPPADLAARAPDRDADRDPLDHARATGRRLLDAARLRQRAGMGRRRRRDRRRARRALLRVRRPLGWRTVRARLRLPLPRPDDVGRGARWRRADVRARRGLRWRRRARRAGCTRWSRSDDVPRARRCSGSYAS